MTMVDPWVIGGFGGLKGGLEKAIRREEIGQKTLKDRKF